MAHLMSPCYSHKLHHESGVRPQQFVCVGSDKSQNPRKQAQIDAGERHELS